MKLEKLRNLFGQLGIDGMLVTSSTNVRYMTGFTGSAGLAVISGDKAAFITDFRYTEQAKVQVKGFEIIEHGGSLIQTTADTVESFGIKRLGFEQNSMTYGTYASYNTVISDAELVPVAESVEKLRLIKSSEEIKILEEAAKIADDAFRHILTFMKPGISEIAVANELEFYMRSQGADSSSFDMIVASGLRSSLPHGVASDKLIESGDLVTLDFGAYYKGYCSDITRTVAVGQPSDQLKEIYQVVFDAQALGVAHIKPGMTGKEADASQGIILLQKATVTISAIQPGTGSAWKFMNRRDYPSDLQLSLNRVWWSQWSRAFTYQKQAVSALKMTS